MTGSSGIAPFLEQSQTLCGDFPWWEGAVADVDGLMEQDGGHDWGHLWRVLKAAHDILDHEGAGDREVVSAAVLFHDVVNLPKSSPDRHLASTRSAEVAVDHFAAVFDAERLELLHEAIRCHSYSAGLAPSSLEAKVVSDADKFEALGALGIARTFYVCGLMEGTIVDPFDPFGKRRELDDLEYAVDHFFTKLLELEDRFYTDHGRAVANTRTAVLREFLEQIEREL